MNVRVLLFLGAIATMARCGEKGELLLFDHAEPAVKIVVPQKASDGERDAAAELAKLLGEASGARLEIVPEGEAGSAVFVGRTDLAKQWGLTDKDVSDEGYVISVRAAEGKAAIVGGSDMATKFAVYDFLHRFVSVRWFLPGELFQIVPKQAKLAVPDGEIVERPAFSPRTFWSPRLCFPDNRDPQLGSERWIVRNRLSADGRGLPGFFSHNLYRIIDFHKYGKEHPEYFPLRDGKRFVPDSFRHQNWQPCTTNPDVIRLSIEFGRTFFRENPEHWKWFSLGINDGNGWCECENCTALDVPGRTFRHRKFIASDRYYHFVTQVANALLKEFPDRKVGVIAYASVEPRPERIDRLPPNVCVYITHDSSQYHDDEYLRQDLEFDEIWKAVSNDNLCRYDYYGLTWFTPRYFPHIIAEDARRMRQMGIRGIFSEACPAWPTVGPMLYIAARQVWNPGDDPDKHLKEFYTMCFAGAAEPMKRFWQRQEEIWKKDRDGKWFEGLSDLHPQVALYTKDDLAYCTEQIETAMDRSNDDPLIEQRIRFFQLGWTFAANYIKEHLLLQDLEKADSAEKRCELAGDVLLAVHARHQFLEEFRKEGTFLSKSYLWFLEELHRDGNWEMFVQKTAEAALVDAAGRLAQKSPDALNQTIARLREAKVSAEMMEALDMARTLASDERPANVLKNPAFAPGEGEHPTGADWSSQGAPLGWSTWRQSTGEFRFADGIASVRGADNGVVIQSIPVKLGEKVVGTALYRMKGDPPAAAVVAIRWKQADGGWLVSGPEKRQGRHMVSIDNAKSDDWRPVFAFHPAPEGATQAVFMFGAKNQGANDVAEFKEPYFGKK